MRSRTGSYVEAYEHRYYVKCTNSIQVRMKDSFKPSTYRLIRIHPLVKKLRTYIHIGMGLCVLPSIGWFGLVSFL